MKLYKNFLALNLLMISQAHSAVNINVNTTNDEFGENPANCSLREAIEAVNTYTAFGGCTGGVRYITNRIILENKEYVLTRGELVVKADLTINGHGTNDLTDTITNSKPKRLPPTTIINGQFKNRILNTANSRAALTLNNIKLINGYDANLGGAILAGGTVDTFNVLFDNNKAEKMGGAVYLSGTSASISTNNTTWQNNTTNNGAGSVLSMSCLSDLKSTQRTITIQNSSIINNGANGEISTVDACGNITFNIQQSTIANNIANNTGGIIHFNNNTSFLSSLNINHSTIVNNQGAAAFNFNTLSNIQVYYSVIAFNTGGSCLSNTSTTINYDGDYNLYQNCQSLNIASTTTNNHDNDKHLSATSTINLGDLFNPLGNYGGYTQVFLPKKNTLSMQYILDKIKLESCQDYIDQRGSETHSISNVENCDLGSVERRVAIAVVDRTNIFINKNKSDRIIEINVLENDIPSETDKTDDQENARGAFAKDAEGNYLLKLTNTSGGLCSITSRPEDSVFPYIKFDNNGKLSSELEKLSCKYSFTDSNGSDAIVGELFFRIENKAPIANNDSYTLSAGEGQIEMNLTANDNDENDGKYGSLCTSNSVQCNGGYYIRIVSLPILGTIEGESNPCPDHTDTNKYICYKGNLTYRSKNNLAPFNDSFTYVVYDKDLSFSAPATVSILSQNSEKANDTGGSLAWWSILSLTGLAVYRRRKSRIA